MKRVKKDLLLGTATLSRSPLVAEQFNSLLAYYTYHHNYNTPFGHNRHQFYYYPRYHTFYRYAWHS